MKYDRPLQDKELTILDQRLKQHDKRFKRQIRFLLIWTLLALVVGTFAFFRMETKSEVYLLIATVAIYIGIGVWIVIEDYLKEKRARKSIEYLKKKNLVTVIEVNSDRYYELKEDSDEGVYYLFQLDNNKVFSFGGQDFYPDDKFPCDKFEIVEGRGIRNEVLFLETFIYGKAIKPIRVIEGKEKWDMFGNPNYPDPEKLTIVEGKIENYLQATTS